MPATICWAYLTTTGFVTPEKCHHMDAATRKMVTRPPLNHMQGTPLGPVTKSRQSGSLVQTSAFSDSIGDANKWNTLLGIHSSSINEILAMPMYILVSQYPSILAKTLQFLYQMSYLSTAGNRIKKLHPPERTQILGKDFEMHRKNHDDSNDKIKDNL
uniref:Uncharacterized protein n=1 Tax=Romanomermis culicivorax TaxID=13658 RepID=A0A915HF61_ROMCU